MNLTGSRDLSCARDVVWRALMDPDVLRQSVPGCTEMAGSPEDGFDATVVQKVGPVKATFKGRVTFAEIVDHESLTLSGEGKGGAAGFAKGGARVTLTDLDAGGTRLNYEVDAAVGGKLAQLGSRIIDSFAVKMADQFFATFQDVIDPKPDEEIEEAETNDTKTKTWLSRLRTG